MLKSKKKMIKALYAINNDCILSIEKKRELLNLIFSGHEVNEIIKHLVVLESIFKFGQGASLQRVNNLEELEKCLLNIFTKNLGELTLPQGKVFTNCYEATVAKARNSQAILAYAGCLERLPESEKKLAKECLKKTVQAILQGPDAFRKLRYGDTPQNKHMELVYSNPKFDKKEWLQGAILKNLGAISHEAEKKIFHENVKQKLYEKFITDKHLQLVEGVLSKEDISLIHQCFHEPSQLNFESILKDRSALPMTNDKVEKGKQKFVTLIVKILNPQVYPVDKQKLIEAEMPDLNNFLAEQMEFTQCLQDLDDLSKMIKGEPINAGNYFLIDTDDWEDLLLSGTEVLGSCQSCSGDPSLNKCLLAYLIDPKIRMIALKDAHGRIVARRMFRVLWDKVNKVPVLYKERLYGNPGTPPLAIKKMDEFFIERAKAIGATLVSSEGTEDYNGTLESFYSPAPFEYVDALRLGKTEGRYSLNHCFVIHR